MPAPAIAYPIPLEGAKLQGVASADRPICAMLSARAIMEAGGELRGAWKGQSFVQNLREFDAWFLENDVPHHRVTRCVRGILGERLVPADVSLSHIDCGDLVPDPYQVDTVRYLTKAGGLIAADPGMGKTLMAVLAACFAAGTSIAPTRCYIICPLAALGVWEKQRAILERCYAEVRIVSRDSLHKLKGLSRAEGGLIIFDEIHGFRRMDADRTKLAHQLRLAFDMGIGLTGTLLHGANAVEGALSMLDLCVPGAAMFASRWGAGEHFACLVKKQLGPRTVTALERPSGERRTQFLDFISTYARLIGTDTHSVRATWQLPEQHLDVVELGKPWRSLTEQAMELVLTLEKDTGELPHAQRVAHALCRAGIEAKIDWLDAAWDDHDEPLVIFAQYHDSLDALESWLKEMAVTYVRVDGSVLGPDRAEMVRKFQEGEVTVFLGQIAAAGIAVDLYRARISVAFDHTWKGDEYAQALRRTSRRGQTQECYHFDLSCNQLQSRVIDRLIAAEDFNTEAIEYQEIHLALTDPHSV